MKYGIVFFISLFISLPALAKVEHYDAIVNSHQTHFQRKHPGQEAQYFELGSPKPSGQGESFLVVDGKTLSENLNSVDDFFTENPEITLLLDLREGDGFVEKNELNLKKSTLKESIHKLCLSNINEDVTSIGDEFLSGCSGLTALDFSCLSKLTSIGSGFLFGCSGLTAFDFSCLSRLTSIGDECLSDCSGLTALDLSPLSSLTSIGFHFLSDCSRLTTLDLSPLSQLTSIGDGFLYGCSGLTALDLSPLSPLTSIGDVFLSGCSGLTALDLSPLRELTSIGDSFLFGCHGLTALDLSCLSNLTSIGDYFLSGAMNLVKILNPELTRRNVLIKVVAFLRESNNPLQQQEGHRLYQAYLLEIPDNLKELMAGLNLEKIRANVPLALADIETLSPQQVVTAFDALIVTLRQFVDRYNQDLQDNAEVKNKEEARLTFHDNLYEGHLKSQLQNLFIDDRVPVTWRIRDDQRPELRIAFKHLLKELQQDKPMNALTDMNQLLHAFAHCESRNVSVVNQILMQRGLGQKTENTKLGKVWGWVNALKLRCFANYMGENTDMGAHDYGRKFTSINAAIGLPVAVRSFKERISQLSDEEMHQILGEFLTFFNKNALIEAFLNENPLSPKEARDLLGAEEEYERLKPYTEDDDNDDVDIDGYFVDLSGVKRGEFDYKTTPFSRGETKRLLTVLGVIK